MQLLREVGAVADEHRVDACLRIGRVRRLKRGLLRPLEVDSGRGEVARQGLRVLAGSTHASCGGAWGAGGRSRAPHDLPCCLMHVLAGLRHIEQAAHAEQRCDVPAAAAAVIVFMDGAEDCPPFHCTTAEGVP